MMKEIIETVFSPDDKVEIISNFAPQELSEEQKKQSNQYENLMKTITCEAKLFDDEYQKRTEELVEQIKHLKAQKETWTKTLQGSGNLPGALENHTK